MGTIKDFIGFILIVYIMFFFGGFAASDLKYIGSCNKKNTYIGNYTGLSFFYNLGCVAGSRIDDK